MNVKPHQSIIYKDTSITDLIKYPSNSTTITNPLNAFEYNITIDLTLTIATNTSDYTDYINSVPVIKKVKTDRMHKDCTLNAVGKWNAADQHCYAYMQLTSLCLVVDSTSTDYSLLNY